MVRIENWAVVKTTTPDDLYTPPEKKPMQLSGIVYGHCDLPDGEDIVTSVICKTRGRVVQTRNTSYVLGEPHADYLAWLKEHDMTYNPDEPVRLIEAPAEASPSD